MQHAYNNTRFQCLEFLCIYTFVRSGQVSEFMKIHLFLRLDFSTCGQAAKISPAGRAALRCLGDVENPGVFRSNRPPVAFLKNQTLGCRTVERRWGRFLLWIGHGVKRELSCGSFFFLCLKMFLRSSLGVR